MSPRDPGRVLALSAADELLRVVKQGPLQKILGVLIDAAQPISTEELGTASGYEAWGGSFNTYLSRLSSLGLIDRSKGIVHPTSLLFPEGLCKPYAANHPPASL